MREVTEESIGYGGRPWAPIPDSGTREEIVSSTQIVGVGNGLDGVNEIDKMIESGFAIYRIEVLSIEEEMLMAIVSLWKRPSDEEQSQSRFRSTTGLNIG